MSIISRIAERLRPYFTENIHIILWFFLAAALLIFALHGLLSAAYPYSLDYGEAPLIDQAMRLAAGENIYRSSIETPPYTIANYPPMYVISLIPTLGWFDSPFHMGRLISFIAALLSALFIGLIIFDFSQDRLSALAAASLFLASPYVVQWSGRARIDMLALAFATGALFVLARWPRERWSWLAGGLLLVLAAYTRQSYALAAPLAGFVWLWVHNKQRAIALAVLVGGIGAAVFLLVNLLTGGGFYYNIVTANVNEFSWIRLQDQLERLWNDGWIVLMMSVVFLGIGWRSQKSWTLLAPFLVGAFISALTIGKIGSNVNYFLELAAAMALVAGIVLVWSRSYAWRNVAVVLLVAIQFGYLLRSSMGENVDWILATRQNDIAALEFLEQEVKKMDDPILADEDMGMLTMNGRPLYIQPFEVTQLANAGMWDEEPLLEEIAAQKFDGILIHHFGPWPVHKERWSPEMLARIDTYYRPEKTLAGTVVYVPRGQTEISAVPDPGISSSAGGQAVWDGQAISVGEASFMLDASVAVNPTDPNHVVAIATRFSKQECDPPTCKVGLVFFDSRDGGQTWRERVTFGHPQLVMHNGQVAFDPSGTLRVMGVRGDLVVLNQATSEEDYLPSNVDFVDATAAQVGARPWLRLDPESGEIFLTLDAQEGNMLFVTPSLIRSQDGVNWSLIARADQHVSATDISTPRAAGPDSIQVLFGGGDQVSLVWVWDSEPWTWPRTVWMANSSDGGVNFGEPTPILETWGPINSLSANGQYVVVYRTGSEENQNLAVATTADHGKSWTSTIASGDVPLSFNADIAPGIGIAPDGSIDLVFIAQGSSSPPDCGLDVTRWQEIQPFGRLDPCEYNVFYTYSSDGGHSFAQPLQLNPQPIRGRDYARLFGASIVGASLSVASSQDFAYPVWVGTPQPGKTQLFTAKIAR